MTCAENTSLAALPELTRAGFIRFGKERAMVSEYVSQFRVKTPSLETPIAGLSGGNQQKIALAKWLARRCGILIVDEPTRGVDVGAKAEMHALLDRLACDGAAVIVISSELPEVMALSRRILVMREGAARGELQREQFAQETLMRLMAGLA
jgi:ABC-type sugar transport system ATPase subunit